MSYTLTIERPKGKPGITKTEWKAFVATQPDMSWSTDGATYQRGSKEVTYYVVYWTGSKYAAQHPNNANVPYMWMDGKIHVPAMGDNDHAYAIARRFRAQLCGEDGPEDPPAKRPKTAKRKAAPKRPKKRSAPSRGSTSRR